AGALLDSTVPGARESRDVFAGGAFGGTLALGYAALQPVSVSAAYLAFYGELVGMLATSSFFFFNPGVSTRELFGPVLAAGCALGALTTLLPFADQPAVSAS